MLVPKLFTTLQGYTRQRFVADFTAGIIVGIVALPLAIAFAIASGLAPEKGLYTAIVAGFIISALGGSQGQIGGPTGAFVVIAYGIVQQYGTDGLTVATMMAGVILIILGVAKLGPAIKFIPSVHFQPVIAITNSALFDEIGEDNICGNIDDALNRARMYLGLPTEERPAFARPDIAREMPHGERRRRARP